MRTIRASLAAAAVAAMSLTACSSGDSTSSASTSSQSTSAASGKSAGGKATAQPKVGKASASCDAPSGDASYPMKIEHAYGTTTIPAKPTRIATVAWANHEVPLALGVATVGMSKATWGDDDGDGVMPWVQEKLTALGAQTPALFDETDGVPDTEVFKTKPDVILASYSGLTQEQYDKLSKIAPVVAYPERAWGTSMECMIRMNSKAIGMPAQGEQLIKDLKKHSDDALNAHPSLKGKKVLFGSTGTKGDFSKIGFYTTHDSRAGFLARNGFGVPKIVAEETKKTDQFFVEVSTEKIERFDDVDVFLTYGPEKDNAKIAGKLKKDELISQMPAVKKGRIAVLGYSNPLAAAANPSPLSIPWGLNKYYDVLADSLK